MGQEKCVTIDVEEMPPETRIITASNALAGALQPFWRARQAALDLEADSLYHYREKVCLIQLAAPGCALVVDPLALDDFSALKSLLASQEVEIIVHGGDYDVRSLFRDFRISVSNLFDTELASRFLGDRQTGLDAVLNRRFGVELNKKYQKKDWSQRPLPPEMVRYAVSDTIYLIPLADRLKRELTSKKRLQWVAEECEQLSRVRTVVDNSAPLFLKFKGAGKLEPRSLAVLESLLQWRDRMALKRDLPPFKVLTNRVLMKLALTAPRDLPGLNKSSALSPKQIDMYGEGLLARINAAVKTPPHQLPVYPRVKAQKPSAAVFARIKRLKKWRDRVAEELALDPAIVITKAQLTAVADRNPVSLTELEKIDALKNWQVQTFGSQIIDAISP